MSSNLVANRYAKALFRLLGNNAEEAKKHMAALAAVKAIFATEDGGKVLRSPVMPGDLKLELLSYALKQGAADPKRTDFIKTTAEAGRITILPEIIDAYNELILNAEGVVSADLACAYVIADEDVKVILEQLGKVVNKKLNTNVHLDESLLGGFVAKIGNFTVDMSLKSRIEGLAQQAAKV